MSTISFFLDIVTEAGINKTDAGTAVREYEYLFNKYDIRQPQHMTKSWRVPVSEAPGLKLELEKLKKYMKKYGWPASKIGYVHIRKVAVDAGLSRRSYRLAITGEIRKFLDGKDELRKRDEEKVRGILKKNLAQRRKDSYEARKIKARLYKSHIFKGDKAIARGNKKKMREVLDAIPRREKYKRIIAKLKKKLGRKETIVPTTTTPTPPPGKKLQSLNFQDVKWTRSGKFLKPSWKLPAGMSAFDIWVRPNGTGKLRIFSKLNLAGMVVHMCSFSGKLIKGRKNFYYLNISKNNVAKCV